MFAEGALVIAFRGKSSFSRLFSSKSGCPIVSRMWDAFVRYVWFRESGRGRKDKRRKKEGRWERKLDIESPRGSSEVGVSPLMYTNSYVEQV